MALDLTDLERIERLINKVSGDIAIAIARGFERLEERIDGAESRNHNHIVEVENKIDALRSDLKSDAK